MQTISNLTHLFELHVKVTYNFGHGFEDNHFEGWVYLNGDKLIARKLRGRNVWHLCNIKDVVSVERVWAS